MVYEHLRRIPNTNIYTTPDEPADPRDCARYPDSPYCGGTPFSLRPVALRPQIVNNECAKGVKITPVLGFVKLPPVEVIHIEPRCRPPAPPEPPPPQPEPFPPDPPNPPPPSTASPSWECDGETLTITASFAKYSYSEAYQAGLPTYQQQVAERDDIFRAHTEIQPGILQEIGYYDPFPELPPEQANQTVFVIRDRPLLNPLGFGEPTSTYSVYSNAVEAMDQDGNLTYVPAQWVYVRLDTLYYFAGGNTPFEGSVSNGVFLDINYLINIEYPDCPSAPPRKPPPPPPPPPKRKCDCMGCCPSSPTQDKNDRELEEVKRLLRRLLKLVGEPQKVVLFDADPNKPGRQKVTKKEETLFNALKLATQRSEVVSQIVGIEAFPINVPATVISPEKSGIWGKIFAFIDGKKRRKLKSLAELIAWQSEQDAAVMGKWHQSIDIEDSDAVKEGDQPQKIVLPNVAETLKEQILLLANLIQSQGLMMDVALKSLHESSATKLEVAKTLLVVKDIQEYLDYDTEQRIFKVPIQISVPDPTATEVDRSNLTKYLDPSETQIVSDEWMGRDSFQEALTDLRNAASMIRASLSNKV